MQKLISVWLWLFLLEPSRLFSFLPLGVRLVDILSYLILFLFKPHLNRFHHIILALFASQLVSILLYPSIANLPFNPADLNSLGTLLLLFGVISVTSLVSQENEEMQAKLLLKAFIVVCCLTIAQYFNILNFAGFASNFLENQTQFVLKYPWRRAMLFSTNGNYLAFQIVLLFILVGQEIAKSKYFWFFIVISFLSVILTFSRLGLFCYALCFLSILFNKHKTLSFLVVPLIIFASTIIIPLLPNFRISDTESFDNSYSARLRDFIQPFTMIFADPTSFFFGRGPLKSVIRTDSHNGFTWFWLRFGLIGLVLYLRNIAFFLRQVTFLQREKYLILTTWLLFEFGNNIFKDVQSICLLLFAMIIMIKRDNYAIS